MRERWIAYREGKEGQINRSRPGAAIAVNDHDFAVESGIFGSNLE